MFGSPCWPCPLASRPRGFRFWLLFRCYFVALASGWPLWRWPPGLASGWPCWPFFLLALFPLASDCLVCCSSCVLGGCGLVVASLAWPRCDHGGVSRFVAAFASASVGPRSLCLSGGHVRLPSVGDCCFDLRLASCVLVLDLVPVPMLVRRYCLGCRYSTGSPLLYCFGVPFWLPYVSNSWFWPPGTTLAVSSRFGLWVASLAVPAC